MVGEGGIGSCVAQKDALRRLGDGTVFPALVASECLAAFDIGRDSREVLLERRHAAHPTDLVGQGHASTATSPRDAIPLKHQGDDASGRGLVDLEFLHEVSNLQLDIATSRRVITLRAQPDGRMKVLQIVARRRTLYEGAPPQDDTVVLARGRSARNALVSDLSANKLKPAERVD